MSYIPPSKCGNAISARSGNAFKSASSYTDKTPVVIAPPETDDLTAFPSFNNVTSPKTVDESSPSLSTIEIRSAWGASPNPRIMQPKPELPMRPHIPRSKETFTRLVNHREVDDVGSGSDCGSDCGSDDGSDDGSGHRIPSASIGDKYKFNPTQTSGTIRFLASRKNRNKKKTEDDGWIDAPCPEYCSVYTPHPTSPRERDEYIQGLIQGMMDRHHEYRAQEDEATHYASKYRYSHQQDDENIKDDY